MSDSVISAQAGFDLSQMILEINGQALRPYILRGIQPLRKEMETTLKSVVSGNGKYALSAHAGRGVKSKPFQGGGIGFTVYFDPKEWLYIFQNGTYKTPLRPTKKPYTTTAYTDSLGRKVPKRTFKAGISRGGIAPMGFFETVEDMYGSSIFERVRSAVETAVNERISQL